MLTLSDADLDRAARRLRILPARLRKALLSPPCAACKGDGVRRETDQELRARRRARAPQMRQCAECDGEGY